MIEQKETISFKDANWLIDRLEEREYIFNDYSTVYENALKMSRPQYRRCLALNHARDFMELNKFLKELKII
jgi:hypothetical protein